MIILILLAVTVVCFILVSILKDKVDVMIEGVLRVARVCCVIVLGTLLIIVLISYPSSLITISKMENFYERNQRIFLEAVGKFPDAVKTKEGTVETVSLSWDYTKEVLEYNQHLEWYKRYQDHWFFSIFVGKVPDKLQFIEIK